MFKYLVFSIVLFFSFNLSANKTFTLDESNSMNKFSLLEIEPIDDYFRFKVYVMQNNKWNFKSDIFLKGDNIDKKIKADFFNNVIVFPLNEKEFMSVMEGEFLQIRSHLNYQDTFYIPSFRNIPAYEKLKLQEFKNQFNENE